MSTHKHPPGWIPPSEEPIVENRLREIEQQTTLGHQASAMDTHFAATTALAFLEARRSTREYVAQLSQQLADQERTIAELHTHLHGTPPKPIIP